MIKKLQSRVLSLLLAIVLVAGLLPAMSLPVMAANHNEILSINYIQWGWDPTSGSGGSSLALLGIVMEFAGEQEENMILGDLTNFNYDKNSSGEITTVLDAFIAIEKIEKENGNTLFYAWFENPITDPGTYFSHVTHKGDSEYPWVIQTQTVRGVSEDERKTLVYTKAFNDRHMSTGVFAKPDFEDYTKVNIVGGTEETPILFDVNISSINNIMFYGTTGIPEGITVDFQAHIEAIFNPTHEVSDQSVIDLSSDENEGQFLMSGTIDVPEAGFTSTPGSRKVINAGRGSEAIINGKITSADPYISLIVPSQTTVYIEPGAEIKRTLDAPTDSTQGFAPLILLHGELVINGGEISDNSYLGGNNNGGMIFLHYGSSLTINDGTITSTNGTAIDVFTSIAPIVINGGTISSGNWVKPTILMAPFTLDSVFYITGGTIQNTDRYERACAIRMEGSMGLLAIEGGTVKNGANANGFPIIYGYTSSIDYKNKPGYIFYKDGTVVGTIAKAIGGFYPAAELDGIIKLPSTAIEIVKNQTRDLTVGTSGTDIITSVGSYPDDLLTLSADAASLLSSIGNFSSGKYVLTAGSGLGTGALNATYTYNGTDTITFKFSNLTITDATPFTTAPSLAAPVGSDVGGTGEAALSWSASNPTADSYTVSYKTGSGEYTTLTTTADGNGVKLKAAVTGTSATVEGLAVGTEYTFKVTAKKAAYADSDSNERTLTVQSAAKQLLTFSLGGVSFTVDESLKTITATMREESFDSNTKIGTFTLSSNATLKQGSTSLTSGTSVITFTGTGETRSATLTVAAANGETQDYAVTITLRDPQQVEAPINPKYEFMKYTSSFAMTWDAPSDVADINAYEVKVLNDGREAYTGGVGNNLYTAVGNAFAKDNQSGSYFFYVRSKAASGSGKLDSDWIPCGGALTATKKTGEYVKLASAYATVIGDRESYINYVAPDGEPIPEGNYVFANYQTKICGGNTYFAGGMTMNSGRYFWDISTDLPKGYLIRFYDIVPNADGSWTCNFTDQVQIIKVSYAQAPEKLSAPTIISLTDAGIGSWGGVIGAVGYRVQLYKNDVAVGNPIVTNSALCYYDFSSMMTSGGVYTFKVMALSDGVDLESDYSAVSPSITQKDPLPVPTALTWTDNVASFTASSPETNVEGYEISLYKGSALVSGSTETITKGSTYSKDYGTLISNNGTGSYTFKVIAKAAATDNDYTDSAVVTSGANSYIAKLPAPATLVLSAAGVASWDVVANASGYSVQLVKDGSNEGTAQTVTGTSYDFLSAMKAAGAGNYTFKVTAVGDGTNWLTSDEATYSGTAFTMRELASDASLTDVILKKGDTYSLPAAADFGSITGVSVTWVPSTVSTESAAKVDYVGTPVNLPNDLTANGKVANLTVYVLDVSTDTEKLYLNMDDLASGTVASTLLPSEYTGAATYLWSIAGSSDISLSNTTTDTVTATATDVGTATVTITVTTGGKTLTKDVEVIVTAAALEVLDTPENFSFANGVATWDEVEDADNGYLVQLYKDGAPFGTAEDPTSNSFDFLSIMTAEGAGSYTFKVTALGDDTTTMDSAQSAASPAFVIKSIASIDAPAAINNVIVGTAQASAELPSTVTANLTGGGTASIPVTWSGYDSSAAATISLMGTLGTLPDHVINPDNVAIPNLSITFVSASKKIVSFVSLSPITGVTVGTSQALAGLTATVTANLEGGTTANIPVIWSGYSSGSVGTITLTGTLGTLPSGVVNTDNIACPSLSVTFVSGSGPYIPPVVYPVTPTTPDTEAPSTVDVIINGSTVKATENADGSITLAYTAADVAKYPATDGDYKIDVSGQDSIQLNIPISALGTNSLTVTTDFGVVYLPNALLQKLKDRYGDTLQLTVKLGSFVVGLMANGKAVEYNDPANPLTITLPVSVVSGRNSGSYVAVKKQSTGNTILPLGVAANGKMTLFIASTGTYDVIYNAKSFNDISGHWAVNNINFSSARELFGGVGNDEFAPNGTMTRAMFCQVLANLEKADLSKYKTSRFSDVPAGEWFTAAVEWAASQGLASGVGNEKFDPNASITREQMAVMLMNYVKFKGYTLNTVNANPAAFSDASLISTWAKDAIDAIQKAGIVGGKPGNIYDPKGTATRAEVATVFKNFIENLAK